ncbi:MAG: hypothetical protein NVSMB59_01800 [Vulcanimicrobiaceae bacterium]
MASSTALGAVATHAGGSWQTVLLQAIAVTCGLAGAAAMWRRTGPRAALAIVAVAVLARAALLPWPPLQSNDIYRYLWDGEVLARGIDPYVVVPSAPELAGLRTDGWLYEHIDWRDVPTLYPPLDLALYTLGAFLGDRAHASVVPLKAILLIGDVLTTVIIAAGLRSRALPVGRLALYAWNPLVIVEFGLNGHEESVAIACIVAAVLALDAKRPLAAGVALAGAVLSKLYPAALVPALVARRALLPAGVLCAGLVVAAYTPFVAWNRDVLGFLHAFAFGYHFNDSVHRVVGTYGAAALLAGALVIAGIERSRGASALAVALALELAYLLLSPNVYPWYLAIFPALLPLVPGAFAPPLRPLALALLAWTALAPLAYLAPWFAPVGSPLDNAAHVVEYAPLGVAALVYAVRDWRRVAALLGIAATAGCGARAASSASAASPASATAHADIARGANLYAANCAVCHTPTASSFIGPDLTHVADRRSHADLRTHIATSVPGGTTFSPATVDALVAFLTSRNERPPRL